MKPTRLIIKLLVILGMLVSIVGAALAAPPVQTDVNQEYTVQSGDCLATIAERFLGSQRYWPAIWQTTNSRALTDSRFTLIRNPDLIHSGQFVWLPTATEAEALMPQAGFEQSLPASNSTTGTVTVDVVYVGQWYRETFGYSKEAPNIRHFVVIVSEAQYFENPHSPGQLCSSLAFPTADGPLETRSAVGEMTWDLSVLHPAPYQDEIKPGRYYVGGCFIAAPLSRQEAGVGDDVILYAGITGGGASSDYQLVNIEPGSQEDVTIVLSDKNGWACPWVYVFNGTDFERRTEILRDLNSKSKETTQRHPLGTAPVQNGTIRLQIREEKPETSYLDAFHLEVNDVPVRLAPGSIEAGLLCAVDGRYLELRQADVHELTFDVSEIVDDDASAEVVIISTGYYDHK